MISFVFRGREGRYDILLMRNYLNKCNIKEIVSKITSKYFPSKPIRKSETGNILTNMTRLK